MGNENSMITTGYHLDLSQTSASNQPILADLAESYSLPDNTRLRSIAQKLDKNVSADYQSIINQIKADLIQVGVKLTPNIISVINQAIKAERWEKVREILAKGINTANPLVGGTMVKKVIELNNIYRILAYLNSLPGSDGRPVNVFTLAGVTV